MNQRRTTVTASADSLASLEREARRRGVSLTAVLSEAVEEKAAAIRAARRPRVGLGASTDGRRAADVGSEPVARPPA
jgi:Ribbon-helix-helix protein, copG family